MRCLVTGGCGFIGSALVKRLISDGWNVDVVDNMSTGRRDALSGLPVCDMSIQKETVSITTKDLPLVRDVYAEPKVDDVCLYIKPFDDPKIFRLVSNGRYDIIFHQAALPRVSYSVEEPIKTIESNLLASCKLFKAAADKNIPVVFASSSSIYGDGGNLPTHENDAGQTLPKSPYAMQKLHMEHYAKLFGQLYGLRSIGLRYFNVFGPGQYAGSPYATAVAAWCHAIKHDEELRSDGDGEQTRDMCYIDNVIQGNILAAEHLLGDDLPWARTARCYNIACGEQTSNNQILEFLTKRYSEKNVRIRHAPKRPGDVKHTLADISRAKNELYYEPSIRFWDGLEKTLKWWKL